MMRADILVINPNSNPAVTAGLDAALATLRFAEGPSIRCATFAEGPFGIESQKDVEAVTLPLRRMVQQDNAAKAFVIACFSDPGLHVCREATRRPVFGINECGVLTALARGDRFGIIAIAAKSAARHRRYLRQMGLADRLAGERPLEMSVAETASGEGTLARMEAIGRELRYRAGCRHNEHVVRHDCKSIFSGQDGSRVHRLRQGQSRQDQHGLGRHRKHDPCVRRDVQDDDRGRYGACTVS
jgi:Asp/Glu/hydantoin racemase